MNYQLIKRLFDAGFPFKSHGKVVMNPPRITANTTSVTITKTIEAPTLSELIEACDGASFALLRNFDVMIPWQARVGAGSSMKSGDGLNPEQALVNLFLILYENKTT